MCPRGSGVPAAGAGLPSSRGRLRAWGWARHPRPGELRPSTGAGPVPAEGEPREERGREGTRGSLAVGTVRPAAPGRGPCGGASAGDGRCERGRRCPSLPRASATVAGGTGCPSPGPCRAGSTAAAVGSHPPMLRVRDERAGARPY
ncbi:translation initiation factor IF-2-like [Aquila chrysaetos chrysaetos]|uniref:translation initiation factor IF-2-like n=1 Tax=Aquila chrysaetos chrysaetos TaxID=223781 RepID=UPI001176673A|nr:translation initiation factor IF-2-like [Aquila chrysaetos chrysaetos]